MGNMEKVFETPFHEMTWNGPIIFMHRVLDNGKQEVEHISPKSLGFGSLKIGGA